MRNTIRLIGIVAMLLVGVRHVAEAHFRLLEPASWLIEDERGDPQKAGPCGGTNADYGKPSYAVAHAVGGAKMHIKVQETVYHPGHYRVALAINSPTELPLDPKATTEPTPNGPRSVSAEIQNPVAAPVLADGLFVHTERTQTPFETDITLPNINCKHCTLQVVQFMEQHAVNNPGMFTYHHCAMLEIVADSRKPIDAAWPKERD